MMDAKLLGRHVWIATIELVRLPAFSVSTVVFPTLLFMLFGLPNAHSAAAARVIVASYAGYAVIGVALFQFGVGIAQARTSAWEQYVRILAVGPVTRIAAQVLAAIAFSAVSVGVLMLAAVFAHVPIERNMLVRLVPQLLLGGIPFALIGTTIGYWAGGRAALPIANLLYLPLALGGGFWIPPDELPRAIAVISPYLPTRNYGEVLWANALGTPVPIVAWLWLIGYTVVFGATALWGYRRDATANYG
jgi:ABC-2 type transport system permease protein